MTDKEILSTHNDRLEALTEWDGGDDSILFEAILDRSVTEVTSLVTNIGDYAFYQCSRLVSGNFPMVTNIGRNAFYNNTNLVIIDLHSVVNIGMYAFYGCNKLTSIILHSGTACVLADTYTFTNTPVASGNGYIYVPRTLITTYQAATNWSTYAAQFRAIEDYPDICGG